ncbi:MAG: ABC transporter ATP-binding protein, partial [Nitrospirae bacterium]
TILSVEGLKTYYPIKKGILQRTVGWIKAVDSIDIELKKSSTLALVGESGCGKTTAGKSIVHLIKPTSGRVVFDGIELTRLRGDEIRKLRKRFQFIFQDPYSSLDPRMLAGEIIEEGLRVHFPNMSKVERREKILETLKNVGLKPNMVSRYPHEFSGGQRQRLGIARALAVGPDFIVCDEAVSALDVSVRAQILNLLIEIQSKYGISYLFITHDIGVVEYMADEVAVMYLGKIVERGMMEEVIDDPRHPYTKALLSAVPTIDDKKERKISVLGDVASPADPPKGCHFHPRCPERLSHCHLSYPEYVTFSQTHGCHCFLYS